jgi:hypothetical protein
MAFNTTFNNISVIQWQSVLLVEETGVEYILFKFPLQIQENKNIQILNLNAF